MDELPLGGRRPRWWHWPTVLSLDAPAVVVLWQWLFARLVRAELAPPRAFVLGASVWLCYCADRWGDGWRLTPGQIRTQRHYFYRRWRWPVAAAWLAVLILDVAAAWKGLSPSEFYAGLVLVAAVLAYLLLVHGHGAATLPKEACVAALLGGGGALFVATGRPWPQMRPALPLFAFFLLLCFANCALISVWERLVDFHHDQSSWARQFAWGTALARILPWAMAAAIIPFQWTEPVPERPALACALASSLLLGAIDRGEKWLGPERARVLADVALMTPAAIWLAGIRP